VTACEVAKISICDERHRANAFVEIALLPHGVKNQNSIPALIEVDNDNSGDGAPNIQLLESCEYRYVFSSPHSAGGLISTDHADVFQADTRDGHSGRVRPGLYTGTLPIRVFQDDVEIGAFSVEVRSRKLGYLDEYRWMVRDLADQMSEIVMNRFAPSVQQFRVDNTHDAKTLYQRFAFLKSLIGGENFQAALSEIVRRPHVQWVDIHESVHPSKGIKATSAVSRQFAKGGPRVSWDHPVLGSLPINIDRQRTEVSVDTTPNRFVKFALEQWRDVVSKISDLLIAQASNPLIDRGTREVRETLDKLDAVLAEGLFKEVGAIHEFPADNQVLHKREGYRDVFQAYIQFDVAAKLSWEGGEDVYGAGKRDVATLYEYWVFLKLAHFVSELCDAPFDFATLIEVRKDALNVTLKKGMRCVLEGVVERQGRQLGVELWFNRSFGGQKRPEGSWSKQMRPDYSIKISPGKDEPSLFEPVYVHFDAKYRVNQLTELFGDEGDIVSGEEQEESARQESRGSVKRDDLLKMHAYRDAIRRSAGAYVIYPGSEQREYRQYHELLPGLGAFALRPTEGGEPVGKVALVPFLEDVFEHVASQVTQHERGRYWIKEVYQDEYRLFLKPPAVGFLKSPPADTLVLIGYVKNAAHLSWIIANKKYNLRADNRSGSVGLGAKDLAVDLILLSCPKLNEVMLVQSTGFPQLKTQSQMDALGYPNPGKLYFCFDIDIVPANDWLAKVDSSGVESVRQQINPIPGHPVTLPLLSLFEKLG
jgi:predicted component of viral defense system (DUF524 family)